MIPRLTLVLALALAPVLGDTPSPPEQRPVDLRVIAVDQDGNPVTNLTSDDFQIVDAGIKQKVALLRYNDSSVRQIPVLGPNEFSNRGNGEIPHATVILFDLLVIDNQDRTLRRIALHGIVVTLSKLKTADYLYLYLLMPDGLYEVHGLPEAAEASHSASAEPWTRQIKPLMNKAIRTGARGGNVEAFQALDALGAKLSGVPGRKNLIWVTQRAPIEPTSRAFRELSEELDHRAISIYPSWQQKDIFEGGTFRGQAVVTDGKKGR